MKELRINVLLCDYYVNYIYIGSGFYFYTL